MIHSFIRSRFDFLLLFTHSSISSRCIASTAANTRFPHVDICFPYMFIVHTRALHDVIWKLFDVVNYHRRATCRNCIASLSAKVSSSFYIQKKISDVHFSMFSFSSMNVKYHQFILDFSIPPDINKWLSWGFFSNLKLVVWRSKHKGEPIVNISENCERESRGTRWGKKECEEAKQSDVLWWFFISK